MHLLHCFFYLAATGIFGFLLGRLLPKRWFSAECFPFRSQPWEEKLYRLLRVKQWQNKLPDMSRIFPKLMPAKRLTPQTMTDLPRMIEETCVAELIHWLLWLVSPVLLVVMKKPWSIVMTVLYGLSNLPFILIQRYNRPRLLRLYERMAQREQLKKTIEEALPQ